MPVDVHLEWRLPTNPNALVYSTDARALLGTRPFLDLQRMVGRALRRFHEASHLSSAVAFSWRTDLDRRNERHHKLLACFVVDGPATPSQLSALDEALGRSAADWSPCSIERLPTNAFFSLAAQDGRIAQVWSPVEGEVYAYRLVLADGVLRIHRQAASRARLESFLADVDHVRGAVHQPEDMELERARLAFALHFARKVVHADGRLDQDEESFLASVFPEPLLHQLQLHEPAAQLSAYTSALGLLPGRLGHQDKLALVGLLFSACYSDGSLDPREMKVLREAGESLGLSREQIASWLQRYWT